MYMFDNLQPYAHLNCMTNNKDFTFILYIYYSFYLLIFFLRFHLQANTYTYNTQVTSSKYKEIFLMGDKTDVRKYTND